MKPIDFNPRRRLYRTDYDYSRLYEHAESRGGRVLAFRESTKRKESVMRGESQKTPLCTVTQVAAKSVPSNIKSLSVGAEEISAPRTLWADAHIRAYFPNKRANGTFNNGPRPAEKKFNALCWSVAGLLMAGAVAYMIWGGR